MAEKHRFNVQKLVRDHQMDRLRQDNVKVSHRIIVDFNEYLHHLKNKLREEAEEVCSALTPQEMTEEIADLQEVILAVMEAFSIRSEEVEASRLKKKSIRGGFLKKVYCDFVEMSSENSHYSYYIANADRYQEITE